MTPESLERLIAAGRDGYEARLAAGQAWLKLAEFERAVAHLREATRFRPELSMAWQALGTALNELGRPEAARRAWTRGLAAARDKGDQQAEKAMLVFLRRLDRPAHPLPPERLPLDPAAVFAAGRLIALPTETVYGLAAPIDRPDLIQRVFELKGRPPSHPLIVHVGGIEQARACVRRWPAVAQHLAERFWPGPLTLVLPRSQRISDRITAGQDTVALRMPDHPLALAVLAASPAPLVAPSANLFTRLSPTRAEDVRATFPADQVEVVDGGPCRVGIESTIVAVDEPGQRLVLLRPGMISAPRLAAELPPGWRLADAAGESTVAAPGRMREHYRPGKPLTVEVVEESAPTTDDRPGFQLIELDAVPERAAQQLYQRLREADQGEALRLLIRLPAARLEDPAWAAIVNRLRKAASTWQDQGADRGEDGGLPISSA